MIFQLFGLPVRVARAAVLSSVIACAGLLLALMSSPGLAHEVQPSVADLTIADGTVTLDFEATLEPFVAGVDLEGLQDTNASDRADEVDRLRALDPDAMAQAFRDRFDAFARQISVTSGDARIPLSLQSVDVPEVGNVALPRLSDFVVTGALPPGDAPVIVQWDASLGALVLRQMEAGPEAYTGYLTNGAESAPIPRVGPSSQTWLQAFLAYIPVGFEHIVPLGLDHILFVLGLFFLSTHLGPLFWQVSAFTLAHTVTLALAALGIVSVSPAIVEPLIAASIVYVGVENVLSRGMTPWRPAVVLAFGLLHGLGFAGVLTEYGLGTSNFVAKLIGFNVGVELGQLFVIALAFGLVFMAMREYGRAAVQRLPAWISLGLAFVIVPALFAGMSLLGVTLEGGLLPLAATIAVLLGLSGAALASEGDDSYRQNVANPASILIALVGAYWFVERVFL
ncbi:HupE/UreJ family protein [Maribius pontilimi]|uniref:HupE/UreJ family protein n=2 Tax=Palleronia pontilimi TaxID=1964209 RepID=A0A934M9N0_9RHOB|nr:HupE/UreJ family protein [Palleronia pontilimi]